MDSSQIKYPKLFSICIALSAFMTGVDLMVMSVAIDPMRKDLHTSVIIAQWFLTAFAIGCAACYIGIGRISDRIGKRRTFNIGAIVFGISSLLVAISINAWMAITFRFIQGASIAMVVNSATALVMEHFATDERPKRIASIITGAGLGFSLGPIIAGLMLHRFTWRALFYINIPISAFTFIASYISVPKHGVTHEEPINIINLILLTLSIIALSAFFSQGNDWGWASLPTWLVFIVFAALLITFLLSEKHSDTPLIDYNLFKLKNFIAGCSCGFFLYFALIGFMLIFGLYFQDAYGLSHLQTGLAFLPYALGFIITPPIAARSMKKFAVKNVTQTGFILCVLSLPVLTITTQTTPYIYLIMPIFISSIGMNIVNTSSLPIALQFTPAHRQGVAAGIGMMTRWLGGALGSAILAAIYAANIHPNPSHALHTCLWVITIISAIGAIIATFFIQKPSH